MVAVSLKKKIFFKQKTAYEMNLCDWSSDVCSSDLDEALRDACHEVLRQGVRQLIVTLGAHGVLFSDGAGADASMAHLPALAVDAIDVTGAGDAFSAAVCWSLYHDSNDLRLACRRGLKLAAMTLASSATVSPLISASVLDDIEDGPIPLD